MIRRFFASWLCVALAPLLVAQETASPRAASPKSDMSSTLRKGTEVKLILLETISSETAKNGQKVRMAVAEDLTSNGVIVIPKGTVARGEVSELRKAVPYERNGFFEIKPVNLTLANGTKLKLREYMPGEDACGDFGPCWAMWTFFAPLVLIGLTRTAIENRHYREAGTDSIEKRCSTDFGYLARGFTVQTNDSNPIRSPSPDASPSVVRPAVLAIQCSSQQDGSPNTH